MSTFKGRERPRAGVLGGGAGLSAGEGFVYERVRPWGRGAVEGKVAVEGEGEVLPVPRGLKDGKEGIKDVTDDHLLALEAAPGPGALEGPSAPPTGGVFGLVGISTGGVAGLAGGGGGGVGTGFNHFSKNLTTGMRADIVACEFDGELGKGKWITAFAWGGGRGGGGPTSPPPPSRWRFCCRAIHRSFHITSNIPRCSSAARRCAALGNGARSWHSTQISYPYPILGSFVAR